MGKSAFYIEKWRFTSNLLKFSIERIRIRVLEGKYTIVSKTLEKEVGNLKIRKRLLSILLTICMVFGMLPQMAMAQEIPSCYSDGGDVGSTGLDLR